MRAILAILRDSFREAAASRVLWIALGGILLVLMALAPVGLKSVPSTRLRPYELADLEAFLKALQQGSVEKNGPATHLYQKLSNVQREQLQEWLAAKPEGSRQVQRLQSQVLDVVNRLLLRVDFYDPAGWNSERWLAAEVAAELRDPDAESLDTDTRATRNLRRLAAAFPESIDIQDDKSLVLSYGTLTMFGPLRLPPDRVDALVNEIIIGVLSVFLGFFGVFSSLLVTASIIPRTFEPGEISLLLSKPVRRVTLYITRFFGGCLFTLLCAALLVTGTWLLLWLRFSLWKPELLWCIPLYVFLFAIYYSVSALSGAIWRNPIVSLIVVVIFWVVQTTAGVVNLFMTQRYLPGQSLEDVAVAGNEVFSIDGTGAILRWNEAARDWQSIMEQQSSNPLASLGVLRPAMKPRLLVSADGSTVQTLQHEFSRFNQAGPATLIRGAAELKFERETEGQTPEAVFGVFRARNGDLVLPGTRNIYVFTGVPEGQRNARTWLRGLLGNVIPSGSSQAFRNVTPERRQSLRSDAAVAFNSGDDSFVAWDRGTLTVFSRREDGTYSQSGQRVLEQKQAALVATGGQLILTALADGRVVVYDRATMGEVFEGRIPAGDKPRRVEFAADGRTAAVLTHGGELMLYDAVNQTLQSWVGNAAGVVTSMRLMDGQRLLVARRRSVELVNLGTAEVEQTYAGMLAWPFHAYDYVVRPLYRAFPRPGDLDNAVRYLVTGEKTVPIPAEEGGPPQTAGDDLQGRRVVFDPWAAVYSNLGFIAVMLGLGCVYLVRADF